MFSSFRNDSEFQQIQLVSTVPLKTYSITFVFKIQGTKHNTHFGFICKEQGVDYNVGYVFKCQSESVADELVVGESTLGVDINTKGCCWWIKIMTGHSIVSKCKHLLLFQIDIQDLLTYIRFPLLSDDILSNKFLFL